MFSEAADAGRVVRVQRARIGAASRALAEALRQTPPRAVVTLARGSSDNAGTVARYLIETHLRLLTSSAAPTSTNMTD